MRIRRIFPRRSLILAILCLGSVSATALAQTADYRSVVPVSARSDDGLFTVHHVGDRLLFEIPDSLLGRDMALMSRYAAAQAGLADGGDRLGPNILVRWERRDDRVLLRGISHASTAEAGSPLELAVQNSSFAPVLRAFPVQARGAGTSVIDVTDMYLTDVPALTLSRQVRTRLAVRSHDRERSWLEWARSFPINIEIRVVQTYAADQAPRCHRAGRSPSR
jgi:hypothetical protein